MVVVYLVLKQNGRKTKHVYTFSAHISAFHTVIKSSTLLNTPNSMGSCQLSTFKDNGIITRFIQRYARITIELHTRVLT